MASKPSGLRQPNALKASNSNLAASGGASAGPEPPASTPAKPSGGSAIPMSRLPSSNSIRRKITTPLGIQPPGSKDSGLATDTDNFLIGDIVYVTGDNTKRGKITFIGEVEFAKGEFAGIALDLPVGNHDGMVQNKRYFQCAPSHGLFTKLNRLSRDPVLEPPPPSTPRVKSTASYTVMSPTFPAQTPQMSRTTSVEDRTPSPSPTRSIIGAAPSLAIGARVIVPSATAGTKIGILRYLGETDFQTGLWAGVELLTPMGKNNGTVGGKTYFTCQDKYGLFVPAGKVISSPVNKTPRRHGSRESLMSMSSMASSAASRSIRRSVPRDSQCLPTCTLRAVLSEKEQHLEGILKEKELDRIDYENLSRQFEEKVSEVKKLLAENAVAQQQLQASAGDSEAVTNLQNALEEEKRKVEDLQYTLDEEKIMKADLQAQLDTLASKSCEDSKQSFEASRVESEQLKSEIEALKAKIASYSQEKKSSEMNAMEAFTKIEELQKSILDLKTMAKEQMDELEAVNLDRTNLVTNHETQVATLTKSATNLTEAANKASQELSDRKRLVEELKNKQQMLQTQLLEVTDERNALNSQIAVLLDKRSEQSDGEALMNEKIKELQSTVEDLRARLESSDEDKACLRRINAEYKSRISQHEQVVTALKSDLEQSNLKLAEEKAMVENKLQELVSNAEKQKELVNERVTAKEGELAALQAQVTMMTAEVSSERVNSEKLAQEVKSLRLASEDAVNIAHDNEQRLKKAQEENAAIKVAAEQKERDLAQRNTQISAKMDDLSSQVVDSVNESRIIKEELESLKAIYEKSKAASEEKTLKIQELEAEVANLKKVIEDDAAALDKLKQDLDIKLDAVKKDKHRLKEQIAGYQSDSNRNKEVEQALSSEVLNLRNRLEHSAKTIAELEQKLEEQRLIIESAKATTEVKNSQSHIDFLNSVIADQHAKNAELQVKLNVLITGGVESDANSNRVAAAPANLQSLRSYCDICELFDSHDTEDCPKQVSEDNTQHGAVRGESRPYCNSCEIFGHVAGECDDQETF